MRFILLFIIFVGCTADKLEPVPCEFEAEFLYVKYSDYSELICRCESSGECLPYTQLLINPGGEVVFTDIWTEEPFVVKDPLPGEWACRCATYDERANIKFITVN